MSSGSSMLAITFSRPPQRTHCSISIPNDRNDDDHERRQRKQRAEAERAGVLEGVTLKAGVDNVTIVRQ
jgi:hypothetical protein